MYNAILDQINIKEFPEMICDYFKNKGAKEYNNLRSFYNSLLCEISEDIRDSYLNRILKYLSSNTPSLINIIEDLYLDVYDNELMSFSEKIASKIEKYNDNNDFYEKINRKVNYIFYEKEEFNSIKEYNNNQKYSLFLFSLLKHTFKLYKINLPGIASKRLYQEAMSAGYSSQRQMKMLKASADIGNLDACIIYSNYILSIDVDQAVDYLIKAKSEPYILWEIGFSLEKDEFSRASIAKIKKELSECFMKDDFTNKITCSNKNLYLATQVYHYVYNKYKFSKSINSIGKLLINKKIIYNNSIEETISLAKQFLNEGIKLGNINAITNLSAYYLKNQDDSDYDVDLIERLLKTSVLLGDNIANFFYGKMISKKNVDESIEYLSYAEKSGHAKAAFELGKIYELKNDNKKAIEYYNRAIVLGYVDASVYLAKLYILMYDIYKHNVYMIYAKNTLDENISRVSSEFKKLATKLYEDIEKNS